MFTLKNTTLKIQHIKNGTKQFFKINEFSKQFYEIVSPENRGAFQQKTLRSTQTLANLANLANGKVSTRLQGGGR